MKDYGILFAPEDRAGEAVGREVSVTAGGELQCVKSSRAKATRWLPKLRHSWRIGVALTKPVSAQNLRAAFHRGRSESSGGELRRRRVG